jgi:hypothetical protein
MLNKPSSTQLNSTFGKKRLSQKRANHQTVKTPAIAKRHHFLVD